jgi:hypothetical protein
MGPSGGSWTAEFLADNGLGSLTFAINDAGQIVGLVGSPVGSSCLALWDANGMLREFAETGEPLGLSGPAAGPVVAGNSNNTAARWRP